MHLAGVETALEDQGERSLELRNGGLHELTEVHLHVNPTKMKNLLAANVVNILDELGNGFRVGLRLKLVTLNVSAR